MHVGFGLEKVRCGATVCPEKTMQAKHLEARQAVTQNWSQEVTDAEERKQSL